MFFFCCCYFSEFNKEIIERNCGNSIMRRSMEKLVDTVVESEMRDLIDELSTDYVNLK